MQLEDSILPELLRFLDKKNFLRRFFMSIKEFKFLLLKKFYKDLTKWNSEDEYDGWGSMLAMLQQFLAGQKDKRSSIILMEHDAFPIS